MAVVERRFGQTATVGAEQGAGIDADPFAPRSAQQVDGQVRVNKTVVLHIQNRANAVAGIGGDSNAVGFLAQVLAYVPIKIDPCELPTKPADIVGYFETASGPA